MIVNKKIKAFNDKIKQNKAQYDLDLIYHNNNNMT